MASPTRTTTPSTVVLHGDDSSRDRKDGVANAAISPGELLEVAGLTDTGVDTAPLLQPHSAAPDLNGNGSALPRFALENSHTGGGLADDYAVDDAVDYKVMEPGDEVYAFLAAGEVASPDDPMESAGNGALAVHTGASTTGDGTGTASEDVADDVVVGYAMESVDNSGGAEPVRVRVEVA